MAVLKKLLKSIEGLLLLWVGGLWLDGSPMLGSLI
jgi:hypothetical protein